MIRFEALWSCCSSNRFWVIRFGYLVILLIDCSNCENLIKSLLFCSFLFLVLAIQLKYFFKSSLITFLYFRFLLIFLHFLETLIGVVQKVWKQENISRMTHPIAKLQNTCSFYIWRSTQSRYETTTLFILWQCCILR